LSAERSRLDAQRILQQIDIEKRQPAAHPESSPPQKLYIVVKASSRMKPSLPIGARHVSQQKVGESGRGPRVCVLKEGCTDGGFGWPVTKTEPRSGRTGLVSHIVYLAIEAYRRHLLSDEKLDTIATKLAINQTTLRMLAEAAR